jgi:capsular polysaccharide transport system permease protein
VATQVSNSSLNLSSREAQSASLWESFRIQLRVIGALLMREVLTRYGRHNIGFLWMFAEPMIFTVGVTILWNLMKGSHHLAGGMSITAFIFTGYSCLVLWRNVPGRCLTAIVPNHALMFHQQVKPLDVFLSRILLELAGPTISVVLLSIVFVAAGLMQPPRDYLTAVCGWALLGWFASSLALLVGALGERSDIVEKLWHPATYFLLAVSGAFFMVDQLPAAFQSVVLLSPTTHCTEMVREGFLGDQYVWHYSIAYVVVFNMCLMLLGLSQVRYISRRLVFEF